MKPTWKDTSSYSRGDSARTPNEFTLETNHFRLIVHRHVDYGPDTWLFSVHGTIDLSKRELVKKDVEGAKKEAIERLAATLRSMTAALKAIE